MDDRRKLTSNPGGIVAAVVGVLAAPTSPGFVERKQSTVIRAPGLNVSCDRRLAVCGPGLGHHTVQSLRGWCGEALGGFGSPLRTATCHDETERPDSGWMTDRHPTGDVATHRRPD